MSKTENTSSWFLPALTILFIALKLTNYITWSWWWVLAPVWMPVSAVITGFILYFIVDWTYQQVKSKHEKEQHKIVDSLNEMRKWYSKSNARDN